MVGGRGTGKTFWTSALRDVQVRRRLGTVNRDLNATEVLVGHSELQDIAAYPDRRTFAQLLEQGYNAEDVWRTVVHGLLAGAESPLRIDAADSWSSRVEKVASAPESVARDMAAAQRRFSDAGTHALIVFDALDRISADWDAADQIARELLMTALWIKPFNNLHIKVFLREDQYARTIHDFPDASKLKATEARLSWRREDLHGMLWKRLINTPGDSGALLRDLGTNIPGGSPFVENDGIWEVSRPTEATLRDLFGALAGPRMGTGYRRGVPYVWTISRLADGQGAASPRSLLKAMEFAAQDSSTRYEDNPFPFALHYESIKRGIGAASQSRVAELSEDFPWVSPIVETLGGSVVPLEEDAVIRTFSEAHLGGPLDAVAASASQSLPPAHAGDGWPGVIDDLESIGVLTRRTDGRIDMPDIYRIGYNVRRKGGVAPQR
ncbi:hypothetical protein ACXET9_09415 [Brachybacterium sp. DNPG3]